MKLHPGLTLAGATLESPLGSGGQGEVWRGVRADGTAVAVKVLRTADPDQVLRAMKEARLQRTVVSKNIVRLLDFQLVGDTPVIVSELVDGTSLQQLLRRGRPTLDVVDTIARQLFDGVEDAHAHGLIHRDLKPGNVLLERTRSGLRVKLTDFGIAMESAPHPWDVLAGEGELIGTPGFMAPEQFQRGSVVDQRADIFGLGAVLYWLVTGRRAFTGAHRVQVLNRSREGQFAPVLQVAPEVQTSWAEAVVWSLDPSPRRRPADVATLRRAWLGEERLPDWVATGRLLDIPTDPEFAGLTDVPGRDPDAQPLPPPTSFGRERELLKTARQLARHRVVTLRGFAGVGKTHLALQLAHTHHTDFGRPTVFCHLVEASTEAGLLVALAAGLQVPVRGAAPVDLLGLALQGRGDVLVVLDNAEQVVGPLAQVLDQLMEAAPDAQFLVTSRTALGLPGEAVIDLKPLGVDDGVALYLDRARRVRPHLELGPEQSDRLREVILRLEGIPLAIELAAARVAEGSVDALLDELERDRTGHHTAMRAALNWSWRLLRPWEAYTLARCAVFHGGFAAEAAEQIIDLSDWPGAPGVLEVVHRLVDHSLVQVLRLPDSTDRLQTFKAVRSYALQTLDPQSRYAAEGAHLDLFRELGSRAGFEQIHGPSGVQATRRVMAEVGNLASALDVAVARRMPGAAADCGAALGWALTRVGPPSAGVGRLQRVLAMEDMSPWDRSRLLALQGHLLGDAGDYAASRRKLEEALAEATEAADLEQQAHVLQQLGALTHHDGDLPGAIALFEQGLALMEGPNAPAPRRAAILRLLSAVLQHQGQIAQAEARILEALDLAELHGVAIDLPACHIQLGSIRAHQGRPDEATVFERLALMGSRLLGDRVQEGRVLANMGVRLFQLGRPEEAVRSFERAARIARDTGGIGHEAIALGNLGEVLFEVRRMEEAETALLRAISLGDRTWKVVGAIFRTSLARLRIRQDRTQEAADLLQKSAALLKARHQPGYIGHLLTQAELAAALGNRRASARWLVAADTLMRETGLQHELELVDLRRRVIRSIELAKQPPG